MTIASKIIPRDELTSRLASLPRDLVFTNGVFDILHPGHVEYLEAARELGGSLIVAVNSDISARMLGKGADRPINPQTDRATMLAALESVSLVTFFDEHTPLALLSAIRPELYVKGGDYDMETLDETRFLRSYGGNARALPFRKGYSTTALLSRIRKSQP